MHLTPITLDGVTGGHATAGDGPPLVLLPSPFSTARVYRPCTRALARHFRVTVVELPGSSVWPPLKEKWGFADYARWVTRYLDAQNLGPVTLVGHSHTGVVAKQVSLAAPHLLNSIVLTNSVGAWGGWRSVFETLCRCAVCIPLEIRFIASLIPFASINIRRHFPNLWTQLVAASYAEFRHVAARVRVPTLLAWSAHDYVEPLSSLRRLRRAIPHADVYVSCRGSHDWLIDRADEFAAAVAGFARRVARD